VNLFTTQEFLGRTMNENVSFGRNNDKVSSVTVKSQDKEFK